MDYGYRPRQSGLPSFVKLLLVLAAIPVGLVACLAIAAWWSDHSEAATEPAIQSATCQRIDANREVAKGAFLVSNDWGAFSSEVNRLNAQASEAGCSVRMIGDI